MPDVPAQVSMGGVLKQSVLLFARKGLTFLVLGAVPAVLFCGLSFIITHAQTPAHYVNPGGEYDPAWEWRRMSALTKVGVLIAFFSPILLWVRAFAASVWVAAEWSQGRDIGPVAAILRVKRKSLRIPWLCGLFALTGSLLYYIGPVLLLFAYPGLPVAVLEGRGALDSVNRASKILERKGAIVFVAGAITFAASFIFEQALLLSIDSMPGLSTVARPAVSALLLTLIVLPMLWFVSVLTLAYLGLKEPPAPSG